MRKSAMAMMGCLMVAVSGWIAPHSANAAVLENWSSGNDSNWTRADFLSSPPGPVALGGTSFTVSGGEYTLASNASLPALPAQVGAVSIFTPSVGGAYSNGVIGMVIRINNSNTEAFVVARADTVAGNYYNLNIGGSRGGTFLSINKFSGFTSGASLGNVQIPAVQVGQDYNVEFGLDGSTLTGKVWLVGDPQPLSPQISLTDTSFDSGGIGLGVSSFFNTAGPISDTYGAVTFVPEPGSVAPLVALGLLCVGCRRPVGGVTGAGR
jgi:hypothetical protein